MSDAIPAPALSSDISETHWHSLCRIAATRAAGYVGIVLGVVGLGMDVPKVGIFISILSVVGMQVWYVMIALTLLRLSRRAT
jgi:ABC-type proline/glycine betaine transport system permease subunit